jgi:hypothetical protein
MDAAYVFRVRFRLDTPDVSANPASFETVVEKPAAEPGTDGWRFFRDALWRGEASDDAHLRSLAEGWLSVPVVEATFSELRASETYLSALRDAIAADASFSDPPQAVLHAHLGSSIRVD